jgi:hypothetical protein
MGETKGVSLGASMVGDDCGVASTTSVGWGLASVVVTEGAGVTAVIGEMAGVGEFLGTNINLLTEKARIESRQNTAAPAVMKINTNIHTGRLGAVAGFLSIAPALQSNPVIKLDALFGVNCGPITMGTTPSGGEPHSAVPYRTRCF